MYTSDAMYTSDDGNSSQCHVSGKPVSSGQHPLLSCMSLYMQTSRSRSC